MMMLASLSIIYFILFIEYEELDSAVEGVRVEILTTKDLV